ncbi:tetratricopeptide repeat protein [Joostella sp. CR20]|uniref:tetratricopeptide repeat protein n=1 Tax=Joostella sp. CR20 TaxID=2804312 RepID=UPI00313D3952
MFQVVYKSKLVVAMLFCMVFYPLAGQQNVVLDRANQLIKTNKISEAKKVLLQAYKKNDTPALTERLGDVYGIEKAWDSASFYYKKLVDANPKNATYHYKYGGVLGVISLENKMKALTLLGDVKEHFKLACELDDENLDARWASIDLYLKLPGILGGSNEKAYQYAEELYAIVPIEGYMSKSYIEAERKNKELAVVYAKRALDVVAKNDIPDASYKREETHYQIGVLASTYNYQLKAGVKHLLIFEKLYTPESIIPLSDVYYQLAKLYRLQQEKEKATTYIEKAVKLMPNSKEILSEKKEIQKL